MMNKYFLLLLTFHCYACVHAFDIQHNELHTSATSKTMISDRLVFHLDILSPGVFAEVNIFGDATLFAGYQYGGVFTFYSKEENERINQLNFMPQIMVHYRHYYNVRQRIVENKETDKFSADYIGMHFSQVFETEINESFAFAGPVWGLQRNMIDFIHVNFSVGAGYYFSNTENAGEFNHFNLIADVHVGFSF